MAVMTGGDKLQAYLRDIAGNLASAGSEPSVRVGFLEGSTNTKGESIPAYAAMNEFGGTVPHEAGTTTIYRKKNKAGTHFLRQGRFVKRSQSNFSSTHARKAYTATIPPRPFFRNMIKKYSPEWGAQIAALLKRNEFDARKSLGQMGELIVGELRQSIRDTNDPPNAPSTIARKGSSKPLVDSGDMFNSADYEVST